MYIFQVPILKMCVAGDTLATYRRILKRTMTRSLAMEYSYTGLGPKRQRTKKAFSEHPLCAAILGNIIVAEQLAFCVVFLVIALEYPFYEDLFSYRITI